MGFIEEKKNPAPKRRKDAQENPLFLPLSSSPLHIYPQQGDLSNLSQSHCPSWKAACCITPPSATEQLQRQPHEQEQGGERVFGQAENLQREESSE